MHLLTGILVRELLVRLNKSKGRGRAPFEITHAIPGRLRVRLQDRSALEQMAATLRRIGGVERVSADARSGSILIHFDVRGREEQASLVRQRIVAALSEAEAAPGGEALAGLDPASPPLLRQQAQQLLRRADAGLLDLSRGAVDLQTLLGLTAASFGAKTLLLPGRLGRWNGLVLLYWSFGLLRQS